MSIPVHVPVLLQEVLENLILPPAARILDLTLGLGGHAEALLAKADSSGKRAEAYFYEAMRRLSSGKREEAHDLWSKVVETKMMSFFEFEMASRYLRTGAPVRPEAADKDETI